MIFYVACIPTLEAIVCVAAFMIFMRGRCTPLYTTITYTLPRSHQQEAPTQFLSLRAVARNERNMPLATEERDLRRLAKSPMPRLVVPNWYTDTMYIR